MEILKLKTLAKIAKGAGRENMQYIRIETSKAIAIDGFVSQVYTYDFGLDKTIYIKGDYLLKLLVGIDTKRTAVIELVDDQTARLIVARTAYKPEMVIEVKYQIDIDFPDYEKVLITEHQGDHTVFAINAKLMAQLLEVFGDNYNNKVIVSVSHTALKPLILSNESGDISCLLMPLSR